MQETDVDYIIINAAGCGHTLKEYGHILENDPEYKDKAQEFAAKSKRRSRVFLSGIELTAKLSPLTEG